MIEQIDTCAYLFLADLREPEDNCLLLAVEEARASGPEEDLDLGETKITGVRRIEHGAECRAFEIFWENYVAYSVVNESFADADEAAEYIGRRVRRYSRSPFLEYLRRETFASDTYPGAFQHVAVLCENHIVNVASVSEPKVRLSKSGRPCGIHGA